MKLKITDNEIEKTENPWRSMGIFTVSWQGQQMTIVEITDKKDRDKPFGGDNNDINEYRFKTEEAAREFYEVMNKLGLK